jgi:two-component system nitrate/nitrite response regulator NarL
MNAQERATIKVLIVDDHAVFAEGLRLLLLRDKRMEVVGTSTNVNDAVALARQLTPDVVLMDQCIGEEKGIAAVARIREFAPHTAVIILTGSAGEDEVASAVEAGAVGVLDKVLHPSELIKAIERARQGDNLFSPAIVAQAMRGRARRELVAQERARVTEALTPRERDVLALLAAGCDSKTIATRLGLSVHTARDHVQSVLEKMDAHSRIEAVVRAGELGLVRI